MIVYILYIYSIFCRCITIVNKQLNNGVVKVPYCLYNQVRGWIKGSLADHPAVKVNLRMSLNGSGAAGVRMPGGMKMTNNRQASTLLGADRLGSMDYMCRYRAQMLCPGQAGDWAWGDCDDHGGHIRQRHADGASEAAVGANGGARGQCCRTGQEGLGGGVDGYGE